MPSLSMSSPKCVRCGSIIILSKTMVLGKSGAKAEKKVSRIKYQVLRQESKIKLPVHGVPAGCF